MISKCSGVIQSSRSVPTCALAMRSSCISGVVECRRSYFSLSTPLAQAAAGGGALTAMEVAIQVNKLKKAHQSSPGPVRKEVEKEAWVRLQSGLTEEVIDNAEGKAIALLLNSWAYFSKYWERGKDGPLLTEDVPAPEQSGSEPASGPTKEVKTEVSEQ